MHAFMDTPIRREPRSHIREDGHAKLTYSTEAEAKAAAIYRGQHPYLCGQNPSHWHLTKEPIR